VANPPRCEFPAPRRKMSRSCRGTSPIPFAEASLANRGIHRGIKRRSQTIIHVIETGLFFRPSMRQWSLILRMFKSVGGRASIDNRL